MTPRLVVLAQDLIWGDRLARAGRDAGLHPVPVRDPGGMVGAIGDGAALVVIDMTARAYEPLAAIAAAREAGARVLAVGQHDDHDGRKAALDAGADRVLAYRKLFEDGPGTLARWSETGPPVQQR